MKIVKEGTLPPPPPTPPPWYTDVEFTCYNCGTVAIPENHEEIHYRTPSQGGTVLSCLVCPLCTSYMWFSEEQYLKAKESILVDRWSQSLWEAWPRG